MMFSQLEESHAKITGISSPLEPIWGLVLLTIISVIGFGISVGWFFSTIMRGA